MNSLNKINVLNRSIENKLIFFMMFFSTMVVVQFSGRTLFLYIQAAFFAVMLYKKQKIVLSKFRPLNLIFICMFFTLLSSLASNVPFSYKKAGIFMTIYMIPLYFSCTYMFSMLKKDRCIFDLIIKGIKWMCIIQLLWIPLQYVMYKFAGIDVNKLIFNDILHLLEKTTFIRSWVYYPSGLSWHSAILAPMYIFAFVLFDNKYIRLLILFDSFICGSSTSVIGVVVCMMMLCFFNLKEKIMKNRETGIPLKPIKVKYLIISVAVLCIVVSVFSVFGVWDHLLDSVIKLVERLIGALTGNAGDDESTSAHLSYYGDAVKVIKESSAVQILFGYGEGCSGYPISVIHNLYSSLSNWSVECDLVNILLSRGIVGFILYYYFMFYIAVKGYKINYRYCCIILPIFVQGFGYNVQWDYVFLFEIILYFSIKLNYDFFSPQNIENTLKKFFMRFQSINGV